MSRPLPRGLGARGSVLVLAVWSLSLLAVLAASLGYSVRQKATLVTRIQVHEELARAALAGVEKARALMKIPDASPGLNTLLENWSYNPEFKDMSFGPAQVRIGYQDRGGKEPFFVYGLIDEERKINLNTADVETITRLLEIAAGLHTDQAEAIAYPIIDWRDADSTRQHAEYGAENDDYTALAKPYEAKNKPFDAVEELLLVKGMKREIFDKIKEHLTVYGGGAVNLNTADRETLEALGLGDALVEKIFFYRNGIDGISRTADDRFFSDLSKAVTELAGVVSLDVSEETALSNLISMGKLSVSSSYFMVKSRAMEEGRGAIEAHVVMDRSGKIYYCRLVNS